MTPDDLITRLVNDPSDADARLTALSTPPAVILTAADLLHIETAGHGLPWVRQALVREARA